MTDPVNSSRRQRNGEALIGLIGATVAQSLARFGVPAHLAEPVSVDVLAKVRFCLGGDLVYIPKGRPDAEEKAAEAHALLESGLTVPDIARKFGCTKAYVYILIARERKRLREIRRSHERSGQQAHQKPALPVPTQRD